MISQSSVVESALLFLNFFSNGPEYRFALLTAQYTWRLSVFCSVHDQLTNVLSVQQKEVVYKEEISESGNATTLHPKHRSVNLLKDILNKFPIPVDSFLEPCCVPISTAVACSFLPQHCLLVGYDGDRSSWAEGILTSWDFHSEPPGQVIWSERIRKGFKIRQASVTSPGQEV